MKQLRFSALLAFVAASALASVLVVSSPTRADNGPSNAPPSNQSLYHRLGGYDALAAVTDDFIGRLVSDKKLARFFVGLSDDSKARIRQLFLDELCAATGGPCVYIGRDMKTVHKGLNITEADWTEATTLLTGTLDRFGVKQRERDDLFAILTKVKPDIVMVK